MNAFEALKTCRQIADEMEGTMRGHEGMEDAPVLRWAREIREACDSDDAETVELKPCMVEGNDDDRYLAALETWRKYICEGTVANNSGSGIYYIDLNNGPLAKEIKKAVEHYREKAWEERR